MRLAEHHRKIKAFLEQSGATKVRFEVTGGKHCRVRFLYGETEQRYITSNTPSDAMTATIDIQRLRGMLAALPPPPASERQPTVLSTEPTLIERSPSVSVVSTGQSWF